MEDKKIRDKFVSEKLFYYMKLEKLYLGLGIIFSTIRTFWKCSAHLSLAIS